jgi:hypothetical protein
LEGEAHFGAFAYEPISYAYRSLVMAPLGIFISEAQLERWTDRNLELNEEGA